MKPKQKDFFEPDDDPNNVLELIKANSRLAIIKEESEIDATPAHSEFKNTFANKASILSGMSDIDKLIGSKKGSKRDLFKVELPPVSV